MEQLIGQLGVDVKLIVAQMVNFLVVLGILTYFVYRPLMRAIDARNDRIRASLENAKAIEEQNKKLEAERTARLKKVDEEAGLLMEKTKKDADLLRQNMVAAAEKDVANMLEKGRRQLEDERVRIFQEAQQSLSSIIMSMTQKILEREFSKDDQKRIVQNLEKDLPALLK